MGTPVASPPNTPLAPGMPPPWRRRWRRFGVWPVLAVAITLGCAAGTVLGARLLKSNSDSKAHAAFRQSSIESPRRCSSRSSANRTWSSPRPGSFSRIRAPQTPTFTRGRRRCRRCSGSPSSSPGARSGWCRKQSSAPSPRSSSAPPRAAARSSRSRPAAALLLPGGGGAGPRFPAGGAGGVDYCAESSLIASRDTGKGIYTAVNLGEEPSWR